MITMGEDLPPGKSTALVPLKVPVVPGAGLSSLPSNVTVVVLAPEVRQGGN
jgi:hypothetical protein